MPDAVLRERVEELSAWRGQDIRAHGDYAVHLSRTELAEVADALAALGPRASRWWELTTEDFGYHRLAERLREAGDELEDGRGFILLRGIPVSAYTLDQLKAIEWSIGLHLGKIVSQTKEGVLVGEVTNTSEAGADVRGYTTRTKLQPHSDPADLVSMLCVRNAKAGGVSTVVSSTAIFNEILEHHPEYIDLLFEGFQLDLKGDSPSGSTNEVTQHRIPVFSWVAGKLTCRFIADRILNAPRKSGVPLPRLALEAVRYFLDVAERSDMRLEMALEPGDVQVLNSHTTLHGRTAFEDADEPDRKRLMLRLWLLTFRRPNPAAEFGDRFNREVYEPR
jgi:hypothetical protein